jgi:ribonucleoside-diphosphate reductase alpha chain
LSNNSAVYINKPSNEEFLKEWMALIESRSGERGIFNRGSLASTLPERRIKVLKEYKGYFDQTGQHIIGPMGTNPCGEIILQSKQFCNLSEIVARAEDTEATLLKKMRIATILGTYQSSLTNFPYLSKEWKERCEKERLLGVSITGQWDSPVVRKPEVMRKLKAEAIKVNKEFAKRFGISESTAITCVKPSGTLSQTVDCSSGMHPRHSKFYIRRIRISATDSLFKMLKDQGVPYFPEVGQSPDTATTYVLEFPVKAPSGSIFRDDQTAIEQLEYWKMVKENYTEHNPSVTISVGNDEWIAVANWVYANWDIVGGLSFLPREDVVYKLAPYEAIDEKTYKELAKRMEHVDYSKIITYEIQNETDLKKELACVSGVCEIV